MNRRDRTEESSCIIDTQLQNIGNILSFVGDLQSLAVKTASPAELAFDKDIGKEVHLDADHPIPLTLFAAPALHIAGKTGWCVTAHLCRRKSAEEIPDRAEDS